MELIACSRMLGVKFLRRQWIVKDEIGKEEEDVIGIRQRPRPIG